MVVKVDVDDSKLRVRLDAIPGKVHQSLSVAIAGLRLKLEALVKQKLSGSVLHVRTGNLRRSIFSDQTETETSVVGRVAQSSDVKYGRIHEFGGKTSPHTILPVKAAILAFAAGGKTVFASRVNHPGSVMPQRSFMRSSLTDMKPEIIDTITQAVREAVK